MPGRPRFKAVTSRLSPISSAREVLTSRAVGFIRDRSSIVTRPRVSGVRRRCRLSTSASVKKASREAAASKPSATARWREASLPQTCTFMPKARP